MSHGRLAVVLLVVSAALMPVVSGAQTGTSEELVRGALLYKFTKFVTWPDEPTQEPAPFRICVHRDDSFAALLARKLEGRSIRERPVKIERLGEPSPVAGCHVVFFARSDVGHLARDIASLGSSVVLTVGNQPEFLRAGGMINLVLENRKLGFEVSLLAVRRAKLDVDARLLRAAVRVEKGP